MLRDTIVSLCAVVVPGRRGVLVLHTHALTALAWLVCMHSQHWTSEHQARQDTLGAEFPLEHFGNRVPHHAGTSEV